MQSLVHVNCSINGIDNIILPDTSQMPRRPWNHSYPSMQASSLYIYKKYNPNSDYRLCCYYYIMYIFIYKRRFLEFRKRISLTLDLLAYLSHSKMALLPKQVEPIILCILWDYCEILNIKQLTECMVLNKWSLLLQW